MKPKVLLVENESDYQKGMMEFIGSDCILDIVNDPDQFSQKYTMPNHLQDVYLIILDFCFDDYTADEKDLVEYIRDDLRYKGLVAIWSVEESIPKSMINRCDAILPKRLMPFSEIKNLLKKT